MPDDRLAVWRTLRVDDYNRSFAADAHATHYMEDGWEPFAVTGTADGRQTLHLRRLENPDGAPIGSLSAGDDAALRPKSP